MSRQTHSARPVGRMDAAVDKRTYTTTGPKASFQEEGQAAEVDWRHFAECTYEDPELFFPIGNTGPALLQIEDAKAVCRRCPSINACFDWAIKTGQDAGVWGGMSEDERRAYKRRVARGRTGTARHYPDEVRAEVVAALPEHENPDRAAYAIGKRFSVDKKSVLRWFEDERSAE